MMKTRERGKPYSGEDEQFIIDNMGKLSGKEMGLVLGRTEQSIFNVVWLLRKAGRIPPGRRGATAKIDGSKAAMDTERDSLPMSDPKTCVHFRLSGVDRIKGEFPEFFDSYHPEPWHIPEVCVRCGDTQYLWMYDPQSGVLAVGVPPVKLEPVYVPPRVRALAPSAPAGVVATMPSYIDPYVPDNPDPLALSVETFVTEIEEATQDWDWGDMDDSGEPVLPARSDHHVGVQLPSGMVAHVDPNVLGTPQGDKVLGALDRVGQAMVEQFGAKPAPLYEDFFAPAHPVVSERITEPLPAAIEWRLHEADAKVAEALDDEVEELQLQLIERTEHVIELRERLRATEALARQIIEQDQAAFKAQLRAYQAANECLRERVAKLESFLSYSYGVAKATEAMAQETLSRVEGYQPLGQRD